MESITMIFYVILFFQLQIISANYEYICEDALMKKPYLKVYNTRLGDMLMDEGPGFYDVGHMKNIYVCINGPVVLYFTRYNFAGDVFDEAKNTLEIHKCQYYNGESTGPGPHQKSIHLKAVLLMGNEQDYTLPSVKAFTAPYLMDENNGTYENVTSIITIGAQRCEVFKGPNKQSITIDYSEADAEFQMCRLAYQTIDRWSESDANETKLALKNEEQLVTEGQCSKRVDLNSKFIENFKVKKTEWDESVKNYVKPSNVPVATDILPKIEEREKNITDLLNSTLKSDNSTELGLLREALKASQADLEKLQAQKALIDINDQLEKLTAKTVFTDADTGLDSLDVQIKDLEKLKKDKADLEKQYEDSDPADTVGVKNILDQYKEVVKKISEPISPTNPTGGKQREVDDAFEKILPKVSEAEEDLKQINVLLQLLEKAKKEVEIIEALPTTGGNYDATTSKEIIKASKQLAETIIVQIYGNVTPPTGVTIPPTVPEANEICIPLPFVGQRKYRVDPEMRGTCYNEKGAKLFGCQLLKARMGEPGICALNEADSDDNDIPTDAVLPASNYLPEHMIQILNLINEIYKKACDRIRPIFAERTNNLLQCYLIKDRSNKKLTVADAPTPERVKFWGKIIKALESCRDEGHALKFARESPEIAKYYLIKGDEFVEIPFLKEQAENEYGFNFAIDMSWKIFATVLGICSPSYQPKIPLINTRFFTLYTEEFLQPIQEQWMSEKDNNVFKRIMSYYYGVGGAGFWADYCMEASFLYSSDVSYRPPRKLPVNSGVESNYFVKRTKRK